MLCTMQIILCEYNCFNSGLNNTATFGIIMLILKKCNLVAVTCLHTVAQWTLPVHQLSGMSPVHRGVQNSHGDIDYRRPCSGTTTCPDHQQSAASPVHQCQMTTHGDADYRTSCSGSTVSSSQTHIPSLVPAQQTSDFHAWPQCTANIPGSCERGVSQMRLSPVQAYTVV